MVVDEEVEKVESGRVNRMDTGGSGDEIYELQ